MNDTQYEKFKYKKAGSLHNIRIRPGMRSGNVSPHSRPNDNHEKEKN